MYSGTVTEQDSLNLSSRVQQIVAALEAERDADQNRERLERLARDGQFDAVVSEAARAHVAESRVAALQAELKNARAELEKLARVDEARARSLKSIREYNYSLESENETLAHEVKALRKWRDEAVAALRPFGKFWPRLAAASTGDDDLFSNYGEYQLAHSDFRHAARIVEQADHLADSGKMVERSPASQPKTAAKTDSAPDTEPDPVAARLQRMQASRPASRTGERG